MDIINLLKQEEDKTLEFKQDLSSPDKILRTVVAFANTAGGIIVIGVEDKTRNICGIKEPRALEERLANLIIDNIEPQLLPEIQITSYEGVYLLTLQVFPSSVKPHYLRKKGIEKGTFIRVGSTTRLADGIMISELKRVKMSDPFDREPMPLLSSEDIDFRVASELFSDNFRAQNLETLHCITSYQGKKVPTNGGIILFGKKRLDYFPHAWIQVGRFNGINKTNIVDTQEITSYPVIAIDEALAFVQKHATRSLEIPGVFEDKDRKINEKMSELLVESEKKYSKFEMVEINKALAKLLAESADEKISNFLVQVPEINKALAEELLKKYSLSRHVEKWNVPLTAIREAIINAVAHADYTQRGAPIRISIFDDRIEIENPGLLPFGLTIEDIKTGISKLRNNVIGDVFHKLKLVEKWGSGITRMIDSCIKNGFLEPKFEEIGSHFRVTIFTLRNQIPMINETEQTILDILKQKNNGLSTKEIALQLKKSERATRSRLIDLIEKGLIVEIGRGLNDPKRKYFYKN